MSGGVNGPGPPADAPRATFLSARLAAPARLSRPTVSRTLLFPSVQGEHVRGMDNEQQQAEWHPHLGSLVPARAGLLAPRLDGPAATRRRGARGGFSGLSWSIRSTRGRSHLQGPTVRPRAGLQVEWRRRRNRDTAPAGRSRRRGGALTRSRLARSVGGRGTPGQGPGGLSVPYFAVWRRSRPLHCPTHVPTGSQTQEQTYTGTDTRTPSDPHPFALSTSSRLTPRL